MTSIETQSRIWTLTIEPLQIVDGESLPRFSVTVTAKDEAQAIRRGKRRAARLGQKNNDYHLDYCKYEDDGCITLSEDPDDYAVIEVSYKLTGHTASPFDSDALIAEFRSLMAEIPTLEGNAREQAFERATAAIASLDQYLSRASSHFPRVWTRNR